jgi:large subunit ribosomal protein L24
MQTKMKHKIKLKKGDTVMVISGNYKGKTGRVLSVDAESERLLVEGVNMVKKHTKPNAKDNKGGIVKKESSLNISNLMLIDPKLNKPTRVGRKLNAKGKLVRYSKKSGEEIE